MKPRLAMAATAIAAAAGLLILVSTIGFGSSGVPAPATGGPVAVGRISGSDLPAGIARLQQHLREQPRDAQSWASLGVAYIEQARRTANPSYYAQAEGALDRSLNMQATDNDAALAGLGALSAARHKFTKALEYADQALHVNAFNDHAMTVRTDALTELGRYEEALAAARHADETQPGIPSLTRLSYQAELRGSLPEARRLLMLSADFDSGAADVAYARFHLGELARKSADRTGAAREYAAALAADPRYVPALAGQARLAAAAGDLKRAVSIYQNVIRRLPAVEYVVALGELHQAMGQEDAAADQFAVARAQSKLAEANGVGTDLETALFEADHGDVSVALAAARAEWSRRHSVHVADALGWAMHRTGDDRGALAYVRAATALGTKESRFWYHRGIVEAGAGQPGAARASLARALALDPAFDPLRAPEVRRMLDSLESAR